MRTFGTRVDGGLHAGRPRCGPLAAVAAGLGDRETVDPRSLSADFTSSSLNGLITRDEFHTETSSFLAAWPTPANLPPRSALLQFVCLLGVGREIDTGDLVFLIDAHPDRLVDDRASHGHHEGEHQHRDPRR